MDRPAPPPGSSELLTGEHRPISEAASDREFVASDHPTLGAIGRSSRGSHALYEVTDEGLRRQPVAAFAALGMYERADLQRLLRDDVSALGEDLLVIAEEFGEWEDARRRIDLLALDKTGRLVVIELKRTDDGGHMELQAIR